MTASEKGERKKKEERRSRTREIEKAIL